MGSVADAAVWHADTARAAALAEQALDEIERVIRILAPASRESELARFNALGGSVWFPCTTDLFWAIDSSLSYANLTDGAFDPTVEPLVRAWDARGKGRVPKPRDLEAARRLVGWRHMMLDPSERRALLAFSGMGIDLDRISRGLALDRAAGQIRRRKGMAGASLGIAGERVVIGRSQQVTIVDPLDASKAAAVLTVLDGAISTASTGAGGFAVKGRRYAGIFDPRTGEPVSSTASVTVMAPSATGASAIAAALLVMGRDAAESFVTKHAELSALWLEPGPRGTKAWKWNVVTAEAASGATIEWMD